MSATRISSFSFEGGLNLVASPGNTKPGELLYVENFICEQSGGYQRIAGYERFDGRAAPSQGTSTADIDARRAAISPVPGEGPILGVWVYKGTVYAFRNAVGGASCVMWAASGSGWVAKKTGLAPNGKYRFVNNNFKGSASSAMMYGVSGVHKAFQWDGATWTDISTGMPADTPRFIEAHKNYLWLGFANGSLQNSPVGDPTGVWTPRTGANDIGLGDEITALVSHKDALVAYANDSVFMLYGASNADWNLKPYTRGGGALPDCVGVIGGDVLAWDSPGAVYLQAAVTYGNFTQTALSSRISSLVDKVTPSFVLVDKSTGTWRMFCADGRVLVATLVGSTLIGWAQIKYDRAFACGCVGESASGSEVMFAGGSDGYVYQLDVGTSFDGAQILSVLRTAFSSFGSPLQRKRYKRLTLEIAAASAPVNLKVQPDYNYGEFGGSTSGLGVDMWATGGGGLFDGSNWDGFVFDAGIIGTAYTNLSGVASSMGLLFNHTSSTAAPFMIAAAHIQYEMRGVQL